MVSQIKSGAAGAVVYRVSKSLLLRWHATLWQLSLCPVCIISWLHLTLLLPRWSLDGASLEAAWPEIRTRLLHTVEPAEAGAPIGNSRQGGRNTFLLFTHYFQGHTKSNAQQQEIFIKGKNITHPIVHFQSAPPPPFLFAISFDWFPVAAGECFFLKLPKYSFSHIIFMQYYYIFTMALAH